MGFEARFCEKLIEAFMWTPEAIVYVWLCSINYLCSCESGWFEYGFLRLGMPSVPCLHCKQHLTPTFVRMCVYLFNNNLPDEVKVEYFPGLFKTLADKQRFPLFRQLKCTSVLECLNTNACFFLILFVRFVVHTDYRHETINWRQSVAHDLDSSLSHHICNNWRKLHRFV